MRSQVKYKIAGTSLANDKSAPFVEKDKEGKKKTSVRKAKLRHDPKAGLVLEVLWRDGLISLYPLSQVLSVGLTVPDAGGRANRTVRG